MKTIKLFLIILSLFCAQAYAQDTTDLIKQLEKQEPKKTNYTFATFKSTRVINGHSVESLGKGVLDVRILHRFTPLKSGIYNYFGLDGATMRMGFDYGITNNIMVGVGHSTNQKTYDGFIKIKLLRQSTGVVNMPFTVSFLSTMAVRTELANWEHSNPDTPRRIHTSFGDKTSFVEQLIIGRKFSNRFSLQVMPTYIFHHNRIDSINRYTTNRDSLQYGQKRKNTVALGIAGRIKLTKRLSVTAEYYYQVPGTRPVDQVHNSLSIGIDIETGGHIFQMHFTNSTGMTEKSFITDTNDVFGSRYLRFGFNISRVFNIGKH
ncbi:MAG: DUF5777 family beta-barrel protein [Ferruginibacter sp.]